MEFLGIPSKIHKHDEEMKKKRRFLVGFFGQSPRLEFLGMLRGIFIFIILAIIFSSFWPSFGPSFPGKLRDLKGIPRNSKQIHKNDEKMKKKRRFLVGFFGQSPRLEFLGMLRGIFIFIILAIIFSSFWPSFGPSFPGKLRDLKGIPRNSKQIHKNDEKMKKIRFLAGFFGQSPRLELLEMLRGIIILSSFVHHFGLRLVHHFLGSSGICGNS